MPTDKQCKELDEKKFIEEMKTKIFDLYLPDKIGISYDSCPDCPGHQYNLANYRSLITGMIDLEEYKIKKYMESKKNE